MRTVSLKEANKRGSLVQTFGSALYVDWLLVDFASLRISRVQVRGATVHTEPGTSDPNVH